MYKDIVTDMMKAYSEDAVDIAYQKFGKTLDYSEDSLKIVENILNDIYGTPRMFKKIVKRKPSNEETELMSKIWGGYIGEVIRRKWGGNWEIKTGDYSGALTLKIFDTYIFPPAKVYKRLTNGSEDNIWFYYQVLSDGFANLKKNFS